MVSKLSLEPFKEMLNTPEITNDALYKLNPLGLIAYLTMKLGTAQKHEVFYQ
jgi:hypothetical protein